MTHIADAPRYGLARAGWTDTSWRKGLAMTFLAYALPIAIALLLWREIASSPPPPSLAAFNVSPPAAPQEPERDVAPGPEQVKTEKAVPEPSVMDMPLPPQDLPPRPMDQSKEVSNPAPPVEKTTAPEARPEPPAAQASDDKPTWEGLVLAALNKVKRYPREAQFRHLQGVPYIRFVIDREGRVLASRLERSSGERLLDAEAAALPKRAQPLPKPPESRAGASIELIVPVEFFVGR